MKKTYYLLALILLLFALTSVMDAENKTWVGSTHEWNQAANWSPPGIPTSSDNVTILGTQYCEVTGTQCEAASVTVEGELRLGDSGNKLDVAGGFFVGSTGSVTSQQNTNPHLNIGGNITNEGTMELKGGIVFLDGEDGPQELSGDITIHHLIVKNHHGAVITGGEVHVMQSVGGPGELTTDGNGSLVIEESSLPITLTYFAARRSAINTVALEWATVSEIQNYGFQVQRRESGSGQYETVGFVPGQGTTIVPHRYSFTDPRAANQQTEYQLLQQDLDGSTHVYGPVIVNNLTAVPGEQTPLTFELAQNFPNPFNPTTRVEFQIPKSSHVSLVVYDISGKEVAKLLDEEMISGTHAVSFDASRMASGIYLYRLQTETSSDTKRMILLK